MGGFYNIGRGLRRGGQYLGNLAGGAIESVGDAAGDVYDYFAEDPSRIDPLYAGGEALLSVAAPIASEIGAGFSDELPADPMEASRLARIALAGEPAAAVEDGVEANGQPFVGDQDIEANAAAENWMLGQPDFSVSPNPETVARAEKSGLAQREEPPIRAIRMPNGSYVFTNVGTTTDSGVDPSIAGREIRSRDLARSEASPGMSMSALLSASIAQARRERADPSARGGGASFIEGTPEIQSRLALEAKNRDRDLARSTQELEVAGVPAADAAALDNPAIQTGQFLEQGIGEDLRKIDAARSEFIRIVSTPGVEGYIKDPVERTAEITRINQMAERNRKNKITMAAFISGQPYPYRYDQ